MSKVVADMSMSLDGFITGPGGDTDVDRLHDWMLNTEGWRKPHGLSGGETGMASDIMEEAFKNVGAIVMGRRLFDVAEEPWGDTPPFHMPVFVVTHRPHETLAKDGGTSFIFVTDGIESALKQARDAADGKDVSISGASIIQQLIKAGLLDDIQIHMVPVLLGGGRRLFEHLDAELVELETTRVVETPGVIHLKFRVVK